MGDPVVILRKVNQIVQLNRTLTRVAVRINSIQRGAPGTDGVGVPAGGAQGYVLGKASGADYDTDWVPQTGGGGGGAIVNQSTYNAPSSITTAIPAPLSQRSRLCLVGQSGIVINPTIPNGTGTQELFLVGGLGSDGSPVQLTKGGLANVVISGDMNLGPKAQIVLHWMDDIAQWLEAGRNNVF